jgi:hypothetical protein
MLFPFEKCVSCCSRRRGCLNVRSEHLKVHDRRMTNAGSGTAKATAKWTAYRNKDHCSLRGHIQSTLSACARQIIPARPTCLPFTESSANSRRSANKASSPRTRSCQSTSQKSQFLILYSWRGTTRPRCCWQVCAAHNSSRARSPKTDTHPHNPAQHTSHVCFKRKLMS